MYKHREREKGGVRGGGEIIKLNRIMQFVRRDFAVLAGKQKKHA